MEKMPREKVIENAFQAILDGNNVQAERLIDKEYPFKPYVDNEVYFYNEFTKCRIFLRDTFIDRYSGKRLVFPPILIIISKIFPEKLPNPSNTNLENSHIAYWELFPTINHILPVRRGGLKEDDINLVTTSLLVNSAKSHWTLDELAWFIKPKGNLKEWDGLINAYLNYVESNNWVLENKNLLKWHKGLKAALNKYDGDL